MLFPVTFLLSGLIVLSLELSAFRAWLKATGILFGNAAFPLQLIAVSDVPTNVPSLFKFDTGE